MIEASTSREAARAEIAARLAAAGIEDAAREARLMFRALGLTAVELIGAPEAPLGAAAGELESFVRRRAAGEPLSRIEGRRAFWRQEWTISPDVLDPRADTETLVEAALEAAHAPLRVLDFGVGSGAILGALLAEWPQATGVGVDISPAAANVARANLEALGLGSRAEIGVGRWGQGLAGPFDLIVSNPPYIRSADIAGLAREVREHDPLLALDGGPDGLAAYRALAPEISRLLAPGGRFFMEIGAGQGDDVATLLAGAGLVVKERRRDLGGVERVLGGLRA